MRIRRNPFARTRAASARLLAGAVIASHLAAGVPLIAAQDTRLTSESEDQPVRPNRTVPNVMPPATELILPAFPTNEELTRARIFAEPLVPMPRGTAPEENAALARAILLYRDTRQSEKVAPLLAFLQRFPQSAWRPSLLANLGTVYRATGYLSKALHAWDQAWNDAKRETDLRAKAVADFALGEWLDLSGKIGRVDAMQARFDEIRERPVTGRAAQKLGMAREAVWLLTFHHEEAAPSGPAALEGLLAYAAHTAGERHAPNPLLQKYHAMPAGTSLNEVQALAKRVGLPYEMAFRSVDAAFPIPSVIHWRVDHYSALVKEERGRYLLLDPILGGEQWVSREVLDEEASGYVLAPKASLGAGWRAVAVREAATVIGHCAPGAPHDDDPCPCAGGSGGAGGGPGLGMAVYTLHPMSANLRLTDVPLTYRPSVGPPMPFQLSYNQRDGNQPQIFTYGNLGPRWTFDWLSWVTDNPDAADVQADVYLRGGGSEHYTTSGPGYVVHWRSRAVLVKVSANPVRYERRLRDGGVEVFAQSDGVITAGRRVYLTDVIDPQGLTLHFTYDANMRLVAVTDATGLVTTLSYDLAADATKITTVTDPYGRLATLTYNAAGQLASITDAIGLTSAFAYGSDDFVNRLTTPYGSTLFAHESNPTQNQSFRFIQATDPLGGTERVEFRWSTTDIAATAPANQVPTGFSGFNQNLDHYNSLYWDKRAMALYPGDVSKATVTHWLTFLYQSYLPFYWSHAWSTSVPHSVKRPLENRVWYAYADQDATGSYVGSWTQPTKVARVLDDGSSQITQATYNGQGNPTTRTDPLGRQTSYVYASSGIDLIETRQTSSGVNDLLSTFADYTTLLQPQSVTDAAGETTTLTYNAAGQVLTSTNAKNETTTFVYDTDGHLESTTRPMTGAVTTYAYDDYGRLRTATQPDGYATTTDYDTFDRPTRVTYPDGTTELFAYNRLDLSTKTDRLGRTTRYFYDPLRRLIATRDPAGRTVTKQWCTCGALEKLVDARGQATSWERDAQNRVTREVRADGTTATQYTYEATTSRRKTVIDPKGQVTTYAYNLDDTRQLIVYTNALIATPSVSYTYDPAYGRPATMVDGTGTTMYTYHPSGTLGATKAATVDGPLTNDTIAFEYDELGRVVSRSINGVAVTWSYDVLGRVTTEGNVLGTFAYVYDGVTARLASVTYPNGQMSTYTYFNHAGDDRLQTIHHRKPDASTLSKFDYTYDAVGNVLTWQQQADSAAPTVYLYTYDPVDQLTGAIYQTTDPTPTILKRFAYSYDPAGNRTIEQIDDAATSASYDALNRLTSQYAGGSLVFRGTLNEPATVTIQGTPAFVDSTNRFSGSVAAPSGTTTVVVAAADGSGNQGTATYEVDQATASKTFTYDANGNLTGDGNLNYDWDAANRLIGIRRGPDCLSVGSACSEFTYDGFGRPRQLVEHVDGVVMYGKWLTWCGSDLCEERGLDDQSPIWSVVRYGTTTAGGNHYYVRDHLGSVVGVTNTEGIAEAMYEYDPWGKRRQLEGAVESTIGFTGHYFHGASGLNLTPRRAYDGELGRWISEDPSISALALPEGPNLYGYVGNRPTGFVDPTGQSAVGAGGIGFGVAVIFTGVCVKIVENTWRQFQNPYEGTIDPSQRLKHCVVECEITKNCIGGSATAAAAGWLNEQFGDHDEGDRDAGRQGRKSAQSCPQKTCFLQCEDLLKNGSLYK